jgi:hypothetical protein
MPTPPPFWSMAMDAAARGLLPTEVLPESLEDALEAMALSARDEEEVTQLLALRLAAFDPTHVGPMQSASFRRAPPARL